MTGIERLEGDVDGAGTAMAIIGLLQENYFMVWMALALFLFGWYLYVRRWRENWEQMESHYERKVGIWWP